MSHAVYQFFNNGGTQCYIVRVASANAQTANIVLRDRFNDPEVGVSLPSLTIEASSPGVWGNSLSVVIQDGTKYPTNEFNLSVYWEDELIPLERFEDLSMVDGAPNFVETVTSSSNYIRVSVEEYIPPEEYPCGARHKCWLY